jgi:hypothetical protein
VSGLVIEQKKMSKVFKFQDFIKNEAKDVKAMVLKQTEAAVWPGLFVGNYLTEQEKDWLQLYLASNRVENVSESLFTVIKDGIKNMKDSKIGKAVAAKLSSIVDNATKFANYIGDLFMRSIDKIVAFFVKQYQGAKKSFLEDYEAGKLTGKIVIGGLAKDVDDLKKTCDFWLRSVPKILVSSIKDVFTKSVVEEALGTSVAVVDNLQKFDPSSKLNEGIFSFLDDATKYVQTIPPFSFLSKINIVAGEKTTQMLTKFSDLTVKLGGPGVFLFGSLSAIIGFYVEYTANNAILGTVDEILSAESMLRFVPMAGLIIKAFGIVAMSAAIIETTREIIQKERESGARVRV